MKLGEEFDGLNTNCHNENLTLTVVITNYNKGKYISACLDSVLSQTRLPEQIVVYDDCSSDGSKLILQKYASEYSSIKIIYGDKNVGVSCARNRAVTICQTDYICIVDADDFFYSTDKIEREMQLAEHILKQTGKLAIPFSQTVYVRESGLPKSKPKLHNFRYMIPFRIKTRLFHDNMPRDYCVPLVYFNDCGGYDIDCNLFEDWELLIKLLETGTFVFSGTFGTAYRQGTGGLSLRDGLTQLKAKEAIFRKYPSTFMEKAFFYILAYGSYIITTPGRFDSLKSP